jgi:hypothetical protein
MKNKFQNIVINQCFKVIKGLVKWFEKNNTNFNIIIFLKFCKNLPKYLKNISRIKNHQRDNNGFLIVLSKIRSILQNLSNNLNKSQFGQGLLHKNKSQKFGHYGNISSPKMRNHLEVFVTCFPTWLSPKIISQL